MKGNPGLSGAGAIARDWLGEIIAIAAQKLNDGMNNVAEVGAALLAIQLGLKLKIKKLYMEGDSQVIVNAIQNGAVHAWQLVGIVTEINILLHSFEDFKISHIRSEGNNEAYINDIHYENFTGRGLQLDM